MLAQLPRKYPHRRGNCERIKRPLLGGRGNLGGILRDNLGEGDCESKKCRETVGSQLWRPQTINRQPTNRKFLALEDLTGNKVRMNSPERSA